MSATNTNEPENRLESPTEGGYGSPSPEQELPDGVDSVDGGDNGADADTEVSLDDAAVDDAEEDVALGEVPDDAATNPGSPDPTLAGDESDAAALGDDPSLGAPDKNFFQNEDSGSDGEPGAGRFGGTDDQFNEELSSVDPGDENLDAGDGSPVPTEAPSTDAPLSEGNTSDSERGPFSSESDADASGDPV
ncbi:hypothetical protein ACFUCV_03480 [Specibacter sp. NPDC057265]|uniref:hypothetical protein n=1 Tax=Specibacter sp. NPDC057265 TaxID=3346075 RepID=UPI0036306462